MRLIFQKLNITALIIRSYLLTKKIILMALRIFDLNSKAYEKV